MTDLFKFPRTPHLAWLGHAEPRGDKVLSPEERASFQSAEITVEEKVDGANIGLSLAPNGRVQLQNRGSYLGPGSHPQFGPLWGWISENESALTETLGTNLVLFGEWCFAVHSVRYDRLPGYLLAFDVYDRTASRFWSTERRDALLERLKIPSVPRIAKGVFDLDDLSEMLAQPSRCGANQIEGLYLRKEGKDWLKDRAKLVREEFVQAIEEHWSRRPLEKNRLATSAVNLATKEEPA